MLQKLFRSKTDAEIRYVDCGKEKVIYTLSKTSRDDLPSVLAFAMPKSGSVLLDRLLRELTATMKLPYVSIMEEFFKLGIPDNLFPKETSVIFRPNGYCYGGFRYLPKSFEIPIVHDVKKILLIRDPRDMLVSHYFSMLKSHPERGKKLDSSDTRMKSRDLAQETLIDDYVLRMRKRFKIFLDHYQHLCETDDVKIYRYEDIIYDKVAWVEDICRYFDWPIDPSVQEKIAKRHDVIPKAEDDSQHVRQVHPGNYAKKLKPETIDALTEYFEDSMTFYGYAPKSAAA